MQAVRLTIPGKFWDVQIYSGRLYLFLRDGSICTVNWDRLIDEFRVPEVLRVPLVCAFRRSDYLYGGHWSEFFQDPEIKSLIVDKFSRLGEVELSADLSAVAPLVVGQQESPFPFPHADSRIYARRMFVGSGSGVFAASCGKNTVRPISTRVEKLWDGPAVGLSAYSMTLAIAAGEDGLFESRVGETYWTYPDEDSRFFDDVRQVEKRPCEDCEWVFNSIFASSHKESYLARFSVGDDRGGQPAPRLEQSGVEAVAAADFDDEYEADAGPEALEHPIVRAFDATISAEQIFGTQGYSWARRERVVQTRDGVVRVARFEPWKERSEQIGLLSEIQIPAADVVSGGVAVFGTIVECDGVLKVIETSGKVTTIDGEPVRWRVYPRSRHYENHLHVIYEDRLEVWSFNHDYFVDQKSKAWGVSVY